MQKHTKADARRTSLDESPEHAHDRGQRVPNILLVLDQVLENVPIMKRRACREKQAWLVWHVANRTTEKREATRTR